MSTNYPKGSEWRKWDLHVHSPASHGFVGDWDKFFNQLRSAKCDVIGINDYFSVEGYKKALSEIEKGNLNLQGNLILPVVEFRMRDVLKNKYSKKSGTNINFHVIFSNQINIEKIETFIKSLSVDNSQIADKYYDKEYLLETAKVYFENDVLAPLENNDDFKDKHLIWLPYREHGGIDEIDPKSDDWIKRNFIKKSHIIGSSNKQQISFFLWKSPIKDGKPKFSQDDFEKWFDVKKPSIKGSDSHKYDYPIGQLKDKSSNAMDRFCWIKANPTFGGLKQIIFEPEDRVYIGKEPEVLSRVDNNKLRYIRSLDVNKKSSYDGRNGVWFQNIQIDFNTELVAIIGNKGSGKSAITDIIGLLGNSKNAGKSNENFSFLNDNRFRKKGFAENFDAKLSWVDNSERIKSLDEDIDYNDVERVTYLPQNYFEKLCNDPEGQGFEDTLKDFVFSHLPIQDRLGKQTFKELIEYKSAIFNTDIIEIEKTLIDLNSIIIELEKKSHPNYKQQIDNSYKQKKKN